MRRYVHAGTAPPDECPACGALADRFEPVMEAPANAAGAAGPVKVIVVGAGIAGVTAVESLRAASPEAEVTLISQEVHLPYYRLNLTRFLAGEITEDRLAIHPESWYEQQGVRLLRGRSVAGMDLDLHVVVLDDGEQLPFDSVVLAAGAHPAVPPIPGLNRDNALSVRTIDDAKEILSRVRRGMQCVCIGGGILGLETAGALARRGAEVAVIENCGWLLPRQLNERAGRVLERAVMGMGIRMRFRSRTAEILGDRCAQGVRLDDGTTVPADLVILATGIRPDVNLAQRAGLTVNRGVLVDDRLATSHPNVWAAGDVAEHRGVVNGLWMAAQAQGSIAGLNALGHGLLFGGLPPSNVLKVLGVDLFSIGVVEPEGAGIRVIDEETDDKYYRLVFRDARLVGAIFVGDTGHAVAARKAIESAIDLTRILRQGAGVADILAGA